jgi:hypothetical protein
VVTGVSNSQIEPIISAMAYANAADQDVEFGPPGDVKTPSVGGAVEVAQGRQKVKQLTYNMLIDNNHGHGVYPDVAAAAEISLRRRPRPR